MASGLKTRRAVSLLEQARAKLLTDPAGAEALAAEVTAQSSMPEAWAVLAEARSKRGDEAGSKAALEEGLKRFPKDPALAAWKGGALVRAGQAQEGLVWLERAKAKLAKDPGFLLHYAWALSAVGEPAKAEAAARKAVEAGGGAAARFELAKLVGRHGRYAESTALLAALEKSKPPPSLRAELAAVRGDTLLFQGDAAGAVKAWAPLFAIGALPEGYLGHFAYAAQLSGDGPLADRLIDRRTPSAGPEDLLLFGLIALHRGDPGAALERLGAARKASGPRAPEFGYEVAAAEGRALRLLGRREEARAKLGEAAVRSEYDTHRLGPRVRVDLSHLAAEEGDFEESARLLEEALELDPGDPEALRAMELTRRRVAWRSQVDADAAAKVEAAQAEAEAMRRRFSSRESELEAEVARAKAARAEAERRAREAVAAAHEAEERAQQRAREGEGLAAREAEADARSKENAERALAGVESVPPELRKGIEVAEATFQRALYVDLPPSPVALLYSGALERALFFAYVRRFDEWLKAGGRLRAFLEGAVRAKGRKVEYFDRFVEAFDPQLQAKAPALGEVGRVLERRHESYLKPFRAFLAESYAAGDDFYDELAEFVRWAKETLRDPSAHGHFAELGYPELRKFREQLMFDFGDRKRGVLSLMLEPRKR